MTKELISEGICIYCKEKYTQAAMARHLAAHLAKLEKAKPAKGESAFLIKVSDEDMFLFLLVQANATFEVIDDFLRDIWVDCCQHLSAFSNKRQEIYFDEKLKDVLAPKLKLRYDYDFGTTTKLELAVIGAYKVEMEYGLEMLSRNEPLRIMCSLCAKKPAVSICVSHMYTGQAFFCNSCAKKHEKVCNEFDEYSRLPVVNSPRMGQCGYDGGRIDKQHDGVYDMARDKKPTR